MHKKPRKVILTLAICKMHNISVEEEKKRMHLKDIFFLLN